MKRMALSVPRPAAMDEGACAWARAASRLARPAFRARWHEACSAIPVVRAVFERRAGQRSRGRPQCMLADWKPAACAAAEHSTLRISSDCRLVPVFESTCLS